MSFFELLPSYKRRRIRSNNAKHKTDVLFAESNRCCFCNSQLERENATLEHSIPLIIKGLSFGKIKEYECKLKISCRRCNNKNNLISSLISDIVRCNTLNEIRKSSTRLCDLVRKGSYNV